MTSAKLKEQAPIAPLRANKWVKLRFEIKAVCNENWSEEQIRLYECVALGSWESR